MAAKTFTAMQNNVANYIDITTTAFKTLVGVWLNDAYQDAWERNMWTDLIDDDFTFESVVDQAEYSLETDFGEEVGVWDIANGHSLDRYEIGQWWRQRGVNYDADSLDSGNPVRYVVLPEASKVKLDPPPDTAETYAMPYKKTVSDLSGTDTPDIKSISPYLEEYAKSMAFGYDNQYDKANWWSQKSEVTLSKLIKQDKVKYAQKYQRVLMGKLKPRKSLLGDKSYQ